MTRAPVHVYCYYRVPSAHAGAARQAVALIFRALEERFGVIGRLLQGEEEPTLWMEVYDQVRDAERFLATLATLCAAHDFSALLAPGSARRIERFVALDA